MKQLRIIRKKSCSPSKAEEDSELQPKGNEQLAKDVLRELSDAVEEGPNIDMFTVRPCEEVEAPSPTYKKSLVHASTFTQSHSASLRRQMQKEHPVPKHKFLLRKRESLGSPTRNSKLQRRITYIQYSYSPKKSGNESLEPEDEGLRGNTVFVAKKARYQQNPEIKFSTFIMCDELPSDLANPAIWNDLKRITMKTGRNPLASAKQYPRSVFGVQSVEEDRSSPDPRSSRHNRIRNGLTSRKPNSCNYPLRSYRFGDKTAWIVNRS